VCSFCLSTRPVSILRTLNVNPISIITITKFVNRNDELELLDRKYEDKSAQLVVL